MAICGGISIVNLLDFIEIGFEKKFYSEDKCVRPFHKEGKGIMPGEGAAALLLKRYDDAIRNDDKIYGVIKGGHYYSVGNAISNNGLLSSESINTLLNYAYKKSNVDISDISYLECNTIGNALYDYSEVVAIERFFDFSNKNRIYLGSVEGNIGHLDCVGGIAKVIKILLSFEKKIILKTINCGNDKQMIINEKDKFSVVTDHLDISEVNKSSKNLMTVGISSFGITGIICHIILQDV